MAKTTKDAPPQKSRILSWRESLTNALATFTLFPPPTELPDISWRGQGRDMRRVFRQVNGCFAAVYNEEVSRCRAENNRRKGKA